MAELPKHIQLLDSCRTALKPLFRIMLRSGISYKDFNEVAKSLFVEIATKEYGLRGRDTNVSRVAIMTGLTRKEVKKIRDAGWETIRNAKADSKLGPAAAVLHFWHTDKDYLDNQNRPMPLPYEGDSRSFLSLAKKYGGDVPPGALFKELIRSEAVDANSQNYFYPIKRYFVPVDIDDLVIYALDKSVRGLFETIDYNSHPSNRGKDIRRIQRWVHAAVPKKRLAKVSKLVREDAAKFCEDIDTRLSVFETGSEYQHDRDSKIVGMGVYYYELD